MNYQAIGKILGLLLMFFSLSMLTPIPVSWIFHNHDSTPFYIAFVITATTGLILWLFCRSTKRELRTRDGFLVVFLIWTVLGLFGALPFMLSYSPHVPFDDAFFETVSGLTTTGATALTHLDAIPQAVLFYRQQLQFLGGMGIIVLAIAIMPIIGVGGMQLFSAETSGPLRDNKLTPRITQTAKGLWMIYVGITIICGFCYWVFGMSPFDAICYAFSTVSTGGYAPHDLSINFYTQNGILITSIIFMILGGTNFSLHFASLAKMSFSPYRRNSEFKGYMCMLLVFSVITIAVLLVYGQLKHGWSSMINGIFQVVSFSTTTGYISDSHYYQWPIFLPLFLLLIALLGACSGSTTGGIKVIRALLLRRQIGREINKLIHPNGIFPVKLGGRVIPEAVMSSIWAFISAYLMIFVLFWLLLMMTGLDHFTAFSSLAACLSNAGPGLGAVSSNYAHIPAAARWLLSIAMLLGRLEVFTILVLLSPGFWRS